MITKTTRKMAERRGFAIAGPWEDDPIVEFCKLIDDEPADEFDAAYRLTPDGLFFVGSCRRDTEEWPRWIESDAHLRRLLDAMAEEINTPWRNS